MAQLQLTWKTAATAKLEDCWFPQYSQIEVILKAVQKKRDILHDGSQPQFYLDHSAEVQGKSWPRLYLSSLSSMSS